MLNPQTASKSPLSSRIALPLALVLAGIFGFSISVIQPTPVSKTPPPAPSAAPGPELAIPEAPRETAGNEIPAPATVDLAAFCTRHVTEKRSFVVFKRGTCVVINEPCKDPMKEARRILLESRQPDARFLTEVSSEGDLIVAFKNPVFQRFNKNELARLEPWLRESASVLLTPAESVTAGEGWIPPQNARIGLLARRRMLEDAADSIPVKVIRAKERALASR
jgi:hypothetical protein